MIDGIGRLLRPLVWRATSTFEARHGYGCSQLRALFDASPQAFHRFRRVMTAGQAARRLPPACWYAARVHAMRQGGCDACAQLTLTMAAEAGVAESILLALVDGDLAAMSDEAALGVRYAQAVLARDALEAGQLGARIQALYGAAALADLALGVVLPRCTQRSSTHSGWRPPARSSRGRCRPRREVALQKREPPHYAQAPRPRIWPMCDGSAHRATSDCRCSRVTRSVRLGARLPKPASPSL